jgi:hypothetical protein
MNQFRLQFRLADWVKFIAVFGVILALFTWPHVQFGSGAGGILSILYTTGIALVSALSFMRPKRPAPRCDGCGRSYVSLPTTKPTKLCPTCRVANLPRERRRRLAMNSLVLICMLLGMLSLTLLWPFSGRIQAQFGQLAHPLLAGGLFVVLFVVYAGATVTLYLAGMWRMSNPAHCLRIARLCGGEAGTRTTFGPVSVHVFGAGEPTAMLKDQVETCRRRFESLLGEPVGLDQPLRVLVFGKRHSFDAFMRRGLLFCGNVDGMYIPWSTRTVAITTDVPEFRLNELDRVVRTLVSHHNLDTLRGRPSPLWLSTGVARLVACGGDPHELASLNRRMLAALERPSVLGATELFQANPRAMLSLAKEWQDLGQFTRYVQFSDQSWSIVEFLCCEPERQSGFRGYLREVRMEDSHEGVFSRHFGSGFDGLLRDWAAWVVARGVGCHIAPPPHVREALVDRVIPIASDPRAATLTRVQAIRELGRAGYSLGADALIELLAGESRVPAAELVAALEAIAGSAHGADIRVWRRWREANCPPGISAPYEPISSSLRKAQRPHAACGAVNG